MGKDITGSKTRKLGNQWRRRTTSSTLLSSKSTSRRRGPFVPPGCPRPLLLGNHLCLRNFSFFRSIQIKWWLPKIKGELEKKKKKLNTKRKIGTTTKYISFLITITSQLPEQKIKRKIVSLFDSLRNFRNFVDPIVFTKVYHIDSLFNRKK